MAATPDDCERTATVALPTAASGGSISGDLGTSAALDAFSTVYEFPLTRFKNRQTDKLDGVPRTIDYIVPPLTGEKYREYGNYGQSLPRA